nr:CD99 antigen-like protein 2 isoform X2 [Manis javanica]
MSPVLIGFWPLPHCHRSHPHCLHNFGYQINKTCWFVKTHTHTYIHMRRSVSPRVCITQESAPAGTEGGPAAAAGRQEEDEAIRPRGAGLGSCEFRKDTFQLKVILHRRETGSGDFDEFSLEDALKETSSVKQRWDHVTTTTRRPGTTRAPAKPAGRDFDLADILDDRNDRDDGRRKPSAGGGGVRDFDLADGLDDRNDRDDGRRKPSAGGGGGFSDKDLEDILGGDEYKPDRGKGHGPYGGGDDSESGMSAETGTIAGVASALAMALIGAVSSYISYQQKKFCFSIQQGLSADYVKGENLEAVVCEEPQVKYLVLETQSAEPPPSKPPRI